MTHWGSTLIVSEFTPAMGLDDFAINEQDSRKTQGTVQKLGKSILEWNTGLPPRHSASNPLRENMAGTLAPFCLFLSYGLEEVRAGTWAGHGHRRVDVDTSGQILFHRRNGPLPGILGQGVEVDGKTLNGGLVGTFANDHVTHR